MSRLAELATVDGAARMISEIIDYANVTDKQVAKLMNVDARTVYRWRNGESEITLSNAVKLFHVLNVPFRAFINDNTKRASADDRDAIKEYLDHYASDSEIRDMRFNLTFRHGSSVPSQLALVSMLNHMKLVYRLMVAKTVLMLWDIASKSDGLQYADDTMPEVKKVYDAIVKSQLAFDSGKGSYTDI